MVIVNTRRAATKTQRLFIRTVCIKITYAGGLIVHAAAGFAAIAIMVRIWQEEKKRGLKESMMENT